MTQDQPAVYTVAEAAAYLGLSVHSVERYQRLGRLVPFRREPIMFTQATLDDFKKEPRKRGRPGLPWVSKGHQREPQSS